MKRHCSKLHTWSSAAFRGGGLCKSSCLLGAVFRALVALTSFLLCLLLAWTADAEAVCFCLARQSDARPNGLVVSIIKEVLEILLKFWRKRI